MKIIIDVSDEPNEEIMNCIDGHAWVSTGLDGGGEFFEFDAVIMTPAQQDYLQSYIRDGKYYPASCLDADEEFGIELITYQEVE